jgi:hypothetical protein
MATKSYGGMTDGLMDRFANVNTLTAVMGILGSVGLAVQFLGANFGMQLPVSYTLEGTDAVLVTVLAMAGAFASSETREFDHYESWEKILVGVAAVVIVGTEYTTEVSDIIMGDDWLRMAAFAVGIAAWLVVSR